MGLLETEHHERVGVGGQPVGIGFARVRALIGERQVEGELDDTVDLGGDGCPVTDERRAKVVRARARGAPHGHRELLHA